MPYDEHQRLVRLAERHHVALRRVIPELRAHAALADCLVSMPGYNSVCDMLAFRRPAVFVPRAGPSREQQLRAERLREWGLAQVVPATALGDGLLAPAIPPRARGAAAADKHQSHSTAASAPWTSSTRRWPRPETA